MTVQQLEKETQSINMYIKKLEIIGVIFCLTVMIALTMIQNNINAYGSVSSIFFMLFITMMTTHLIEEKRLKQNKLLEEKINNNYK
jgi:multisubunit Na+/H+ antiporter MnhG subunit